MFHRNRPKHSDITWSAPAHWMEPPRRPSTSRAQIHRDMEERRRWMRDTGIL